MAMVPLRECKTPTLMVPLDAGEAPGDGLVVVVVGLEQALSKMLPAAVEPKIIN